MTIKTETRTVEITLNLWTSGWDAGYGPDVFDDMEPNFPCDRDRLDGSSVLVATDSEVNDLIDWWTDEVSSANKGIDGDGLCGLTDDQISSGCEWVLSVDEVEL